MKGFFASSEVQKERPDSGLIPKCGSCGLFKTCQSPKMKPYGDGRKRVLVVGEAPGQTEDAEGRPFIGKAGQRLRSVLSSLGVRLDKDAWTTNALICRPPRNATPESKQIGYCRPNVLACIRENEPRVIVTLGRTALESVIAPYWKGEIGPMEKWAGWKIPVANHWICPTYHPSYVMRMENRLIDNLFADHLEQAFDINEAPPPQTDFHKQIEVLYDADAIAEALGDLDRNSEWAAVDYETNCLKPEYPRARILSFAASNGKRSISYPWTGPAARLTSEFLKSKRTRKIASNLKFEERWSLFFLGHGVRRWGWDTVLAAHVLDNRQGICSLKFQSFVQLGVPTYNWNIVPYLESHNGPYNREEEIALPTLLFYGGMDGVLEHQVAMKQRAELGYED